MPGSQEIKNRLEAKMTGAIDKLDKSVFINSRLYEIRIHYFNGVIS